MGFFFECFYSLFFWIEASTIYDVLVFKAKKWKETIDQDYPNTNSAIPTCPTVDERIYPFGSIGIAVQTIEDSYSSIIKSWSSTPSSSFFHSFSQIFCWFFYEKDISILSINSWSPLSLKYSLSDSSTPRKPYHKFMNVCTRVPSTNYQVLSCGEQTRALPWPKLKG